MIDLVWTKKINMEFAELNKFKFCKSEKSNEGSFRRLLDTDKENDVNTEFFYRVRKVFEEHENKLYSQNYRLLIYLLLEF